jgi:hypothetical protein
MTEGEEFEGLGFDPKAFFEQIRKSASVKAGAIIFGQAQVAYYETLKQSSLSEEQAFNLLAHTTETIIKSIAAAAGPVCEALLAAAAMYRDIVAAEEDKKEMP